MAGRLCAGGRVFGLGRYDVESWIDKKFGTCIDGAVEEPPPPLPQPSPPPPPQRAATAAGGSGAIAMEIPTEITSQAEWQHAAEFSARRAAAGLPSPFQT
ncbi:unnamed protein product [Spirodela intermedia]|nr:unnamed protein product [Spirodela intermedia]CAA6657792.1 unnamed protein product [Spirodela intermedia]